MSATMTLTAPPKNIIISSATTTTTTTMTIRADDSLSHTTPCCPNCGLSYPFPSENNNDALIQAQRQIEDLQEQVRQLNLKASAAVHRWADYENELSQLRAAAAAATIKPSTTPVPVNNRPLTPDPNAGNTTSPRASAASRISQLLSRKPASPLPTTPSSTSVATSETETAQLMAALEHERTLRIAAEEKLAATSAEVEDLSVTLFEEANTMVATERRARAALEERVSVLEQRDREKRERIGRLEGAVRRIERVQSLLAGQSMASEEKGEEGEREAETC